MASKAGKNMFIEQLLVPSLKEYLRGHPRLHGEVPYAVLTSITQQQLSTGACNCCGLPQLYGNLLLLRPSAAPEVRLMNGEIIVQRTSQVPEDKDKFTRLPSAALS